MLEKTTIDIYSGSKKILWKSVAVFPNILFCLTEELNSNESGASGGRVKMTICVRTIPLKMHLSKNNLFKRFFKNAYPVMKHHWIQKLWFLSGIVRLYKHVFLFVVPQESFRFYADKLKDQRTQSTASIDN